jgi:hypothetical protein
VLLITTPEKAESEDYMQTRVYVVDDLVMPGGEHGEQPLFQPLMDLLTTNVVTKTWADNGGTGTLSPMLVGNHYALVLTQTQEAHEEIAATLEALRRAGGLTTHEGQANQTAQQRSGHPAVRRSAMDGMGGMGGGMSGMGGMGGGMGGMGAGMGAFGGGMGGMPQVIVGKPGGASSSRLRVPGGPSQTPFVISVIPVVGPGGPDLLEGVRRINQANQSQKVQSMKSRQDAGQNSGMGGGMGGGAGMF